MKNNLLFALDIGTRSVIGIVAEKIGGQLKIIATERREHNTRAMLDGQIHDVPEVAAILDEVRTLLEKKAGPLREAAVAAAGRALYTVTADAKLEFSGVMTAEDERALDFAAIQAAQQKLAASSAVDDPTMYYCVGYSTVTYTLDDIPIKTLVGQRGRASRATVIATFLPRQVIDSMQSALREAKLEMRALTLEPIAAINVLIPPTMRHLNLVLVDIGAGTSDVAITKNGSVVGYGMVPLAGDEITEAISRQYLLDFNVAERVKRQIMTTGKLKKIAFRDILGTEHKLSPKEVTQAVMSNVVELAQAIAAQIMQLNSEPPQAVLLVGGGSLTPCLPEAIAQALDIPAPRVAIRTPESIGGVTSIPSDLRTPDSVTPLGILKVAAAQVFNFITLTVNQAEVRLFNFNKLTVSDALLAAGISLRNLGGKPGLGLTIKLNGQTKFLAGTMGRPIQLTLNDEPTNMSAPVRSGDVIVASPGADGAVPQVRIQDFVDATAQFTVRINGTPFAVRPSVLLNGESAAPDRLLADRDELSWHEMKNLGEILVAAGYRPTPRKFRYKLNGSQTQHSVSPTLKRNGQRATLSTPLSDGDEIFFAEPQAPLLSDVLGLSSDDRQFVVFFNGTECRLSSAQYKLTVDGKDADLGAPIEDGCDIAYEISEKNSFIVSDILLAADFRPPNALSKVKFDILLNGKPVEFTAPVKNRDKIDVVITPTEEEAD